MEPRPIRKGNFAARDLIGRQSELVNLMTNLFAEHQLSWNKHRRLTDAAFPKTLRPKARHPRNCRQCKSHAVAPLNLKIDWNAPAQPHCAGAGRMAHAIMCGQPSNARTGQHQVSTRRYRNSRSCAWLVNANIGLRCRERGIGVAALVERRASGPPREAGVARFLCNLVAPEDRVGGLVNIDLVFLADFQAPVRAVGCDDYALGVGPLGNEHYGASLAVVFVPLHDTAPPAEAISR